MTENSSDEDIGDWVMYEDRLEWKDVKPVPQNDGPYPVVQIAYSDKYKDVYNYFRGVVVTGEKSERVLSLCRDALLLNPANYTVWQYRRLVLKHLNKNLVEELNYITDVIKEHPKNYQVWHHRRVIVEWLSDGSHELEFTNEILLDDAKNYHAWQHRQWALTTFSLFSEELDYINNLLLSDVRNNSVWNHRYFYFNSKEEGFSSEIVEQEIEYVLRKIMHVTHNESAWNYLRGILIHCEDNITNQRVGTFTTEMYDDGCRSIHLLAFLADMSLELARRGEEPEKNMEKTLKLYTELATKHDVMRAPYWNYLKNDVQNQLKNSCIS